MSSKPRSRLSKKPSFQDITPSLKSKINALKGKYNEFINNCSTFLQEDSKPRSEPKPQISAEKVLQKREPYNEYYKEILKLRRENSVLVKTIQDLSSKVSCQESFQYDSFIAKQFEDKIENKNKIDQEFQSIDEDFFKIKPDPEKPKQSATKKSFRSLTPMINISTKYTKYNLNKKKEYSPLERKREGSPISRSISPKDRVVHTAQKQLNNLKKELEKTREERNLYKTWKDYCSSHPPVPPAIHSIINHYEIEIKKINTINSIINSKLEQLSKLTGDLLNQLDKKNNIKTNLNSLNNLKSEIRFKIKEIAQRPNLKNVETLQTTALSQDFQKLFNVKYGKENKDVPGFGKPDKSLDFTCLDDVMVGMTDSGGLEVGKGSIQYDKLQLNLLEKPNESVYENLSSFLGSPYSKMNNFELSFSNRDKLNHKNMISEAFDTLEKFIALALAVLTQQIQDKYNKINAISLKTIQILPKLKDKINSLEKTIMKKDISISNLDSIVETSNQYKISTGNQLVEYKNEINTLKNILNTYEDDKKILSAKINEKNQEINRLKEIIQNNEDDKRILNDKIISLNKENEKIRKNFAEAEQSKFQISKNTSKLKELMDKHQFTQIKLSELEITHKEKEQELTTLYEKYSKLQTELDFYKSNIQTPVKTESKQLSTDFSNKIEDFVIVFENSLGINLETLPSYKNLIEILEQGLNKQIFPETIQDLIEIYNKSISSDNLIKELTNKNTLIEVAYRKIKDEVISFQESYKEKIEDLNLDKYELVKEIDNQKKEYSVVFEELKKTKDEFIQSEVARKDILGLKNELEAKINRIELENEEKSKRIAELNVEINNTNNYIQKILSEKDATERELGNINKNVRITQATLDNSQIRNEITVLQSHILNLESLNTSLEKAKAQSDLKYKKILKEKEEITEKIEDYIDEIESLKQTRLQQHQQILDLQTSQEKLSKHLESEQSQTKEYKNKLATYICNTNELKKTLRSLTPVKSRDETLIEEQDGNPSLRMCRTLENDSYSDSPTYTLEFLLENLTKITENNIPALLLDWCKKILGHENYVIRYTDTESIISDDSKSNIDNISITSESNQEISYRSHTKLLQQKKIIEALQEKLNDKKKRVKSSKEHIKTLQSEIRRLDSKFSTLSKLDVEYLKSIVTNFVGKLKKIDEDSMTMLQIIFSQLELNTDILASKREKKLLGLFKTKY